MPGKKRKSSLKKERDAEGESFFSGASGVFGKEYLNLIKDRKKESKAYQKHQFIGLELSEILDDPGHKSFYIKLAKERNPEELLALAKDVASRTSVRNRGAYFMRIIHDK